VKLLPSSRPREPPGSATVSEAPCSSIRASTGSHTAAMVAFYSTVTDLARLRG
jgi:hypothetical protein